MTDARLRELERLAVQGDLNKERLYWEGRIRAGMAIRTGYLRRLRGAKALIYREDEPEEEVSLCRVVGIGYHWEDITYAESRIHLLATRTRKRREYFQIVSIDADGKVEKEKNVGEVLRIINFDGKLGLVRSTERGNAEYDEWSWVEVDGKKESDDYNGDICAKVGDYYLFNCPLRFQKKNEGGVTVKSVSFFFREGSKVYGNQEGEVKLFWPKTKDVVSKEVYGLRIPAESKLGKGILVTVDSSGLAQYSDWEGVKLQEVPQENLRGLLEAVRRAA